MNNTTYQTDYLFESSSFLAGMGSVLNISGQNFNYNTSATAQDADKKALENDWGVVGQDIQSAISKITDER